MTRTLSIRGQRSLAVDMPEVDIFGDSMRIVPGFGRYRQSASSFFGVRFVVARGRSGARTGTSFSKRQTSMPRGRLRLGRESS